MACCQQSGIGGRADASSIGIEPYGSLRGFGETSPGFLAGVDSLRAFSDRSGIRRQACQLLIAVTRTTSAVDICAIREATSTAESGTQGDIVQTTDADLLSHNSLRLWWSSRKARLVGFSVYDTRRYTTSEPRSGYVTGLGSARIVSLQQFDPTGQSHSGSHGSSQATD